MQKIVRLMNTNVNWICLKSLGQKCGGDTSCTSKKLKAETLGQLLQLKHIFPTKVYDGRLGAIFPRSTCSMFRLDHRQYSKFAGDNLANNC